MCDPTSWAIAQGTTQIVSVFGSHVGQDRAAKRNAAAASAHAQAEYAVNASNQLAEQRAVSDQMTERSARGMRDIGSIMAVLSDTGLDGVTHRRITSEVAGDTAADLATLSRNKSAAETAGAHANYASQNAGQAAINRVPRPSIIGTGLQIAAIGAETYSRVKHPPKPRG